MERYMINRTVDRYTQGVFEIFVERFDGFLEGANIAMDSPIDETLTDLSHKDLIDLHYMLGKVIDSNQLNKQNKTEEGEG